MLHGVVDLGRVHRLHRSPALGDVGRSRLPRLSGHSRHARGQPQLVPDSDLRRRRQWRRQQQPSEPRVNHERPDGSCVDFE